MPINPSGAAGAFGGGRLQRGGVPVLAKGRS